MLVIKHDLILLNYVKELSFPGSRGVQIMVNHCIIFLT